MRVKTIFLRLLLIGFVLILGFVGWVIYYFNFEVSGPRMRTPFVEAHQKAVKTFLDGQGFGIRRFRKMDYFHERSVIIDGEERGFHGLNLIGASREYGERYFEGPYLGEPPLKSQLGEAVHRPLKPEEAEAIKKLREGKVAFVTLENHEEEDSSNSIAMRVVAPILAEESCMKCHEVKVGELLGAFEYDLGKG